MKQGAGSIAIKMVFLITAVVMVVGCSSGGSSSPVAPAQVCTTCMTFVTAATYSGDIKTAGGKANAIASADSLCMADASKPAGGGTYKAMLVDGVNRVACTTANCGGGVSEHIDWVLHASTTYVRSDGTTTVMITDTTGIWNFVDPITDPNNLPATFDTTGSRYRTGLEWNWIITDAAHRCGATPWTDGTSGSNDDYGFGDRADDSAIGGGASTCDIPRNLLCIQQ
ncbi:MAG: DUF1554 domain-containing protein [Nitrospirota bacterium]